MKMKTTKLYYLIFCMLLFGACKKEFLDKKPSSDILAPRSLSELKTLLDGQAQSYTGALGQMSSDEYLIISDQVYASLTSAIQRKAYIWSTDLYEGEKVDDWNIPYKAIFYANSVLDILDNQSYSDEKEAGAVRGWALFSRAYAYYDLAKNFCKVYNPSTAQTDLGLPLRLSADIDVIEQRASISVTFSQILADLNQAELLLDPLVPALNKNRPSKAAVAALKARIYLYMGDYERAENAAGSGLKLHDKLTDFNTVSTSSDTPFGYNADEVIFQSNQLISATTTTGTGNRPEIEVLPVLYGSFSQNDLRKVIYFRTNTIGKINVKRGFVGSGQYAFTGLSTPELYLIKAECLARRQQTALAMTTLNQLLISRYKKAPVFMPVSGSSPAEALALILLERRKELIWRGIRWSDLKRLNREGANITLTRSINNLSYTLPPNDPRYVFPIPDQEISTSGIQQN